MVNTVSQVTTAILFQIDSTKKKLLYITLSKDGSVYISFPRKSGYKVSSRLDIGFNFNGYKTFSLIDEETNYKDPKISFHPGKRSIHVSCLDSQRLKADFEAINLSKDQKQCCYRLAQIIFPNDYSVFDDYIGNKYFSPLIISGELRRKKCLSLEFFIHSSGTYIDKADIPYVERRNIVFFSDFRHFTSSSHCLVIGELVDCEDDKNQNNGIIIFLPDKNKGFVFKLVPSTL